MRSVAIWSGAADSPLLLLVISLFHPALRRRPPYSAWLRMQLEPDAPPTHGLV